MGQQKKYSRLSGEKRKEKRTYFWLYANMNLLFKTKFHVSVGAF